jgi:hypothetical protein
MKSSRASSGVCFSLPKLAGSGEAAGWLSGRLRGA